MSDAADGAGGDLVLEKQVVASPMHATRERPEAAGLDATFAHVGGWQALSITDSPQTMVLTLVNRTPRPVTAGPAQLRLTFRPGVLAGLDGLALAPESEAGWLLSLDRDAEGVVGLDLAGVEAVTLAPGASLGIRLDGFRAAAAGGSRATRVELDYRGFFHGSGVEVAGTRLLHLPVVRRHAPEGPPIAMIRTGSTARSGPFLAGFTTGADVLNDGKSLNRLRLRIANISGRPVPLAADGDMATRLFLGFRTGTVGAEWGLLGPVGDHLGIAETPEGWAVDDHTIRRETPGDLEPRQSIELLLDIHTSALAGQAQLVVAYENLPAHDDGELVLLLSLGPMVARKDGLHVVKPMTLRGAAARLDFRPGEELGEDEPDGETADGKEPAASLRVARGETDDGKLEITAAKGIGIDAGGGIIDVDGSVLASGVVSAGSSIAATTANFLGRVDAGEVISRGDVAVTGELRVVGSVKRTPMTFKLGGVSNFFYPVAFEDLDWENGPFRFRVFRARTHDEQGQWRGAFQAQIVCRSSNWGHGGDFWSIEAWQGGAGERHTFIAGFTNHYFSPHHVLWLCGDYSYQWLPENAGRISDATDLANPGTVTLGREADGNSVVYERKHTYDEGFTGKHIKVQGAFQTNPGRT